MMFQQCHTATDVAAVYRRLGFTRVCCVSGRVSLIAAPRLGAVAMSPKLGVRVRDQLVGHHRCESTPILTHTGTNRAWVFLVGPAWGRAMTSSTMHALATRGIRVLVGGQRIWLPMNDHPSGWRWLSPPVAADQLPARTTVLAAARLELDLLLPQRISR
ncbi:hypothetical protein AB0H71_25415 [Nocardia sp. NPDC050697]|uniref:hypothetical protein n=1 Tax=Nocardia sp. NPDC050697 TaxID=3155158 RepID=UPI003403A7A5